MNIYNNEENHKSFNEENDKLTKILQVNQNIRLYILMLNLF